MFCEDLDECRTGIKVELRRFVACRPLLGHLLRGGPGQGRMEAVNAMLQRHDPVAHAALAELGIDPSFYTLRWITTLLSREFNLPGEQLRNSFLSTN